MQLFVLCVFFFKQKTAYEIQYGLVGSEMCIRDRDATLNGLFVLLLLYLGKECSLCQYHGKQWLEKVFSLQGLYFCLLYTSDAADERSSVDLGGRRIIKKKNRV